MEAFKKTFPPAWPRSALSSPGTPIEVWCQDEMRVGQKNKLTYRWARKGSRPRAVHDQRTQSTYLFGAVCPSLGREPRWCCQPATAKPCSSISMRSRLRSAPEHTQSCSSIKPAGMAPKFSRCRAASRLCRCRRARPNSMARKTFGSSCGRTGSQIGSSNPSTISSITAATLGTPSSISLGKSCPSHAATGQPWVTQCEDWYSGRIRQPRRGRSACHPHDLGDAGWGLGHALDRWGAEGVTLRLYRHRSSVEFAEFDWSAANAR